MARLFVSPGSVPKGWWRARALLTGPGVNIWVALDEVSSQGGGLAVAAKSHTEEYLHCRETIRGVNTCNMQELDPEAYAQLEELRVVPLMQPGDAIVHTRWLFHRSDPFAKASQAMEDGKGIARYSVRYMPTSATVAGFQKDHATGRIVPIANPSLLQDADLASFPVAEG